MPYFFLGIFIIGFLMDLLLGDPRKFPHFVCAIGNLIAWVQKPLRRLFPKTKVGERLAGGCMVVLVLAMTGGSVFLLLFLLGERSLWLAMAVELFFCWQIPATKCLRDESRKVYFSLKRGDLNQARYDVSMIVGRDTARLSPEEVTKAAVETVAENTSDGIVAPLLYTALGAACWVACIRR